MRHYEKAPFIRERVSAARALAPRDLFTRTVLVLQADLYFLSMPFRWLGFPVQMLIKEMMSSPVWILLVPFKMVEWALLSATTASSFMWTRRPWLRVLVLLPGLLFSRLGYILTLLTPRPKNSHIRELKLAVCDQWPLSWLVLTGSAPAAGSASPTVIEGKWREIP